MASCEKCWADAHSSDDVAGEYLRLITERGENPCTPEQQAGSHATECADCGRLSVHQHVYVCMACGWDENPPGHKIGGES